MHGKMSRIPKNTVFTRDVEILTCKSTRTAVRILQDIRKYYGKQKHQIVTVAELSDYFGLSEKFVRQLLQ